MKKALQLLGLTILICAGFATTVKAQCTANFTYSNGLSGTVSFTDASINTPTNTSYQYNFGDGTFSLVPNVSHTYGANGTYSVWLYIYAPGSCSSSVMQ